MDSTLFYGDNLDILRKHIPDDSVDLVYLDPPFNSKANYNILFKEPSGESSEAQITAFEDTWHWTEEAAKTFQDIVKIAPANVVEMMTAYKKFVGLNDVMAYLTMMCIRLLELRRVLKPTGSIYLHCDPTASHYLKLLMDTVFGPLNFRNEIIWKRQSAHSDSKRYGAVHDSLLFYSKSNQYIWNLTYQPYDPGYVEQYYRYKDENGRRFMSGDLGAAGLQGGGYEYEWKGVTRTWRVPPDTMKRLDKEGRIFYTRSGIPRMKRFLDEAKGMPMQDIWSDLESLRSWHAERLGYPTQKPEALLERLIQASSGEGNVVLDPFCGCGTTITAAQKLGRKWLGIDITHLAINLIKWRLKDMFGLEAKEDYKVVGEPEDLAGAAELASLNRYQFQWWALSLINARPYGEKKKGADTGIDGFIYFSDEEGKFKKIIVQVKSGHASVKDLRDLGHVIDREKAEIGLFLTLEEPTKPMVKEALSKGYYHSMDDTDRDYPRLQIYTIEDLLGGKTPNIPATTSHLKKAPPVSLTPTGELDF